MVKEVIDHLPYDRPVESTTIRYTRVGLCKCCSREYLQVSHASGEMVTMMQMVLRQLARGCQCLHRGSATCTGHVEWNHGLAMALVDLERDTQKEDRWLTRPRPNAR